MQTLQSAKGPRDCSLMEVVVHIGSLSHQYRNERKIYDCHSLPHDQRAQAFAKMCRLQEMIQSWRDVQRDLVSKSKEEVKR